MVDEQGDWADSAVEMMAAMSRRTASQLRELAPKPTPKPSEHGYGHATPTDLRKVQADSNGRSTPCASRYRHATDQVADWQDL